MKYPVLSVLFLSMLAVSGCHKKNKKSPSPPSNSQTNEQGSQTPPSNTNQNPTSTATFDLKLTLADDQYIAKLKALDDGFAFVGGKVLGGSLNGVNWYAQ